MKDWKERLASLVSQPQEKRPRRDHVDLEAARAEIKRFLAEVADPAFDEIERELLALGREVERESGPYLRSLIVLAGGDEEFSYAIRGRAFSESSMVWPRLKPAQGERAFAEALILVQDTADKTRRAEKLTRAEIIEDFLTQYARWTGWSA